MSGEEIKKKIIGYLETCDWPSTTEDVAAGAGVSWNTAQIHLLKLVNEGRIKFKRVGRQNQFWLVRSYNKEMNEKR